MSFEFNQFLSAMVLRTAKYEYEDLITWNFAKRLKFAMDDFIFDTYVKEKFQTQRDFK